MNKIKMTKYDEDIFFTERSLFFLLLCYEFELSYGILYILNTINRINIIIRILMNAYTRRIILNSLVQNDMWIIYLFNFPTEDF